MARGITDNAPVRGGKGMLYEGGIRVPYIFRWPGKIPVGPVCDTPLDSVDLYPTLLEVAGATPPPNYPLDGVSYLKLLEFFEDGRLELYNLREDLGEKNNLAARMPDKVKELHAKLETWRRELKAPMPTKNNEQRPPANPERGAKKRTKADDGK